MELHCAATNDGVTVWDVLTTVGTLGAVVVALWLGLLEQRRTSKRHQDDINRLQRERDEANRAAERQAQERQAKQVAVWDDFVDAPPCGSNHQMHITNYSDAPIMDVAIRLVTGKGATRSAGDGYKAVLLPREYHDANVPPELLGDDPNSLPNRLIVWSFRDLAGRYWKVDLMGRLLYEDGSATEGAIPRRTGNLMDLDEQLTVDNLGYE